MVLTVEELSKWKVETLRSYLRERGVSSSGSNRKADLIEKVVYAEKLGLRVLPTQMEQSSEISANRGSILLVDGVQIPSPDSIKDHWFEGSEYFPDLTLDIVQSYGELSDVAEATDGTASVLQFKKTRGNKCMAPSSSLSSSLRSSSSTSYPPPPSIPEITFKCEDAESFIPTLHLCRSPHDLEKISNMTIGQSSSEDWKNYRLGLVTASAVHEAIKKVCSQ